MDRRLLDTSALSDFVKPPSKRFPTVANHFKQYMRAHGCVTYSEISCFEILRGLRKKNAVAQVRRFFEFCERSELLPVEFPILDRAASLWADGQRRGIVVDDSDLIIAA